MDNSEQQMQDLVSRFETMSRQMGQQQAEIERLKAELTSIKAVPNGATAEAEITKRPAQTASRRKLLKGLALAAAGVTAATITLTTDTQEAQASFDSNGDSTWGIGANPNDGTNLATYKTSIGANGHVAITGVAGNTGAAGVVNAPTAITNITAGIWGSASSLGYGGYFSGGLAPLFLAPGSAANAPTTGTHRKGELYVDNTGQLFYCVADSAGGNGGSWVKLSAPGSTITYLDNPVRVLGTPNTGFTAFPKLTANKVAYFPIVGTQTNTVPPANTTTISATIPTTAVAVIGTLSAFNATSVGFITAYPANAPTVPVVASLLYSAGQFANTSVNLKLGIIPAGQNGAGQLGIGLLSIQDCSIAFDVVAYQS